MRRRRAAFTFLLPLVLLLGGACDSEDGSSFRITVFAASSLTDAFTELGAAFEAANPESSVEFSFAGSPALVTQIQEGAPADVLATAAQSNMDDALSSGIVVYAGAVFARNRLALIVPSDNPAGIQSPYDLDNDGLRLVLAGEEVPAGRYAREALDEMESAPEGSPGFRDAVLANLVSEATNVREVITAVQLGEADAGIVYVTDVTAAEDVTQVLIPDDVNVIASYPIAVTSDAGSPEIARAFIDFVLSDAGQEILESYGFLPPS
jgi:molybdate transport system substrate-binding protein